MSSQAKKYTEVGRVVAIYRYPVKSMGGEAVDHAHIGWHGVAGDRRFGFLREDDHSGLPWMSARETPGALGFSARYRTDEDVERGRATVVTPSGIEVPVDSAALREDLQQTSGHPLRLVRLHRGAFDAMALSMISTSSIESLAKLSNRALDVRRFRANIVISSLDEHPFPEDRWVGDLLVFGNEPEAARMRVNRRDRRCQIVNVDPATLEIDKSILGAIVRERKNQCGVYGSPERAGSIRVGDIVLRRKQ